MTDEQKTPFREWAVLELFGHQRIAGLVSEFQVGGNSLLRVDVPEIEGMPAVEGRPYDDPEGYRASRAAQPSIPAWTKFYGVGALYAASIVDEETARAMARDIRVLPVDAFYLGNWLRKIAGENQKKLPLRDEADYGDDDEHR